MDTQYEKAASENTSGESVQTNTAEFSRQQPSTEPDGITVAIASAVAGAEATTTKSQSISAAETPAQGVVGAGTTAATEIESTQPGVPLSANQDLHEKAVKLLLKLRRNKAEQNAVDTNKSYNQRRKDATNALRPVLTEIWQKFENGESVGGCNGKETWAKSQGITIRWCQKVIAGPATVANSVRLKVGKVVKIGKTQYTLTQEMLDAIVGLAATAIISRQSPKVMQGLTVLTAESQRELGKNQAARKKNAEPAAKTVQTKDEPATKTTELVLVARIGDTKEFGVFPESETEYTTAKALAIGTLQYCEAERHRINAKRSANAGARGNVVAVVNTQMPQEAVAVL
jgi:hypothetical protein